MEVREPAHATSLPTACPVWLGLLCALVSILLVLAGTEIPEISTSVTMAMGIIGYAVPGVIYEFHRTQLSPTGLRPRQIDRAMLWRAVQRSFGIVQILFCAWLALNMLPEYDKDLYRFFVAAWPKIYTSVALLSFPYFILGEVFSNGRPQQDIHRYIGRYSLVIFLYRVWTRPILRQGILAYLVKLFFLPNMVGLAWYNIDAISSAPLSTVWGNPEAIFHFIWRFVNLLDIILAIVGYSLSLRMLGTHVVHTDSSWRGWVATCICYFPFSTVLYGSYLTYGDGIEWNTVLQKDSIAIYMYGSVLLFAHILYLVASLHFGIRFSNLSHKGILTRGLFRFCRHPAYFFKNLIWWMQSVPFIYEGSVWVGVSNCVILFAVNVVYWWRGRTEEMHLSRDPLYVEYALRMNNESRLAFLGKLFPALHYRVPNTQLQREYRIFNAHESMTN